MQKSFNEIIGFKRQPDGFATKAIHRGYRSNQLAAGLSIVTSSACHQLGPDEHFDYQCGRYKNPTRNILDESLAVLDNARFALTYSAGVEAIASIVSTLKRGDGIILTQSLYRETIQLFSDFGGKLGIEIQNVDFSDVLALEAAMKTNTKIVWIESPTNPLLSVLDIKAIAGMVHAKSKAILIVDNTFLTPYFQQPHELGADVVVYSLTKYINGHSDVIMGAVTTNDEKIYETLKLIQISTGVAPSPWDCYVVNRSLKTLPLRMERHSESSFRIAIYLQSHLKIEKVFHPALKSHKNHSIALKQSFGHSGMLSFYIKGSFDQSKKFVKSLKLIMVAESLGGCETTVTFPWMMSHSDLTEDEKNEFGITNNFIRMSVGLEDVDELIEDIDKALSAV